jgi:hypothetical protein
MESKNKTNRLLELIKIPAATVSPITEWEQEQKLGKENVALESNVINPINVEPYSKSNTQSLNVNAYMQLLSTKSEERYNLGEAIRIDEEAQNFVKFLTNYLNLKHPGKKFYLGEVFSNIVKLHRNDYLEVIKEAKLDYLGL